MNAAEWFNSQSFRSNAERAHTARYQEIADLEKREKDLLAEIAAAKSRAKVERVKRAMRDEGTLRYVQAREAALDVGPILRDVDGL